MSNGLSEDFNVFIMAKYSVWMWNILKDFVDLYKMVINILSINMSQTIFLGLVVTKINGTMSNPRTKI